MVSSYNNFSMFKFYIIYTVQHTKGLFPKEQEMARVEGGGGNTNVRISILMFLIIIYFKMGSGHKHFEGEDFG